MIQYVRKLNPRGPFTDEVSVLACIVDACTKKRFKAVNENPDRILKGKRPNHKERKAV